MPEAIETVLVGAGRMGAVHARALRDHVEGLRVVAVVEPDRGLAERAVELLGAGVAVHADLTAALEAEDARACVIAAPTPLHAGLSERALAAGLHVFCEKPMGFDPDLGLALERQAAEADRILQLGYWRRFAAPWRKAKELIDAGAIGRPVWVRSSQWDAIVARLSFCDPAVSGGLLVDFGVHDFDLVEWLTGERITEVDTRVLRLVDPELDRVGDYDNAIVNLRFTGEVAGMIDLSRNAAYGDDVRTEILGERGAIFVDTLPDGTTRVGTADGVETFAHGSGDDAFLLGIAAELTAFAEAAAGRLDRSALPGPAEDRRALINALAARQSAITGGPIDPERGPIASLPTTPTTIEEEQ